MNLFGRVRNNFTRLSSAAALAVTLAACGGGDNGVVTPPTAETGSLTASVSVSPSSGLEGDTLTINKSCAAADGATLASCVVSAPNMVPGSNPEKFVPSSIGQGQVTVTANGSRSRGTAISATSNPTTYTINSLNPAGTPSVTSAAVGATITEAYLSTQGADSSGVLASDGRRFVKPGNSGVASIIIPTAGTLTLTPAAYHNGVERKGTPATVTASQMRTLTIKYVDGIDTLEKNGPIIPVTGSISGQSYTTNAQGIATVQVPQGVVTINLGTNATNGDSAIMSVEKWYLPTDKFTGVSQIRALYERKDRNGYDFKKDTMTVASDMNILVRRVGPGLPRDPNWNPSFHFWSFDGQDVGQYSPLTRALETVQYNGSSVQCAVANPNTLTALDMAEDSVRKYLGSVYTFSKTKTTTAPSPQNGRTIECQALSTSSIPNHTGPDFNSNGAWLGQEVTKAQVASLAFDPTIYNSVGVATHEKISYPLGYYREPINCNVKSIVNGGSSNCVVSPGSNFTNIVQPVDLASFAYVNFMIDVNARADYLATTKGIKTSSGFLVQGSINPLNRGK